MVYYSMVDYHLIGFKKSKREGKKYDAILKNNRSNKIIRVPFGDINYQHYRDKTINKLYKILDHKDINRRELYRKRHMKDLRFGYYSPGYFSFYYLW